MACDLCGNTESVVIWNKADREQQGKLQSVIIPGHIHSRNVMCTTCGLVYVDPKMSKEELNRFYAEDYRQIYGGDSNNSEAERRHAETAFSLMPIALNHLDIGCSTGELLKLTGGWGIEPNIEHYEIAKSRGLRVENMSFESCMSSEGFDVITMLNALEHVYSPTEVLTKINSLLSDGGYLLISVPDIYSRTINLPVDAFLSNAHLYNYSVKTLESLFNKCGFAVVKQWIVTEEIGDKIYFLGQKADVKFTFPVINGDAVRLTRQYLATAQRVFEMKMAIQQAGFN